MAKSYEITNLDKNVKDTQNCDEHLMYRLFLLIETNFYDNDFLLLRTFSVFAMEHK